MTGTVRSVREPLRNRSFRRLFGGHVVSVAGDALYLVAAMWLVFSLTGSTGYTGLAGALVRAPRVFRAFTGPLVDRWPLRGVLVGSELLQGLVVLAVPLAAALGVLHVAVVLAVLPVVALVGQFSGPAQSASLPRVVDQDRLVAANTVVQFSTQAVRAAARVLAGGVVAAFGAVVVYVLDAATFAVCALVFATATIPGDRDADRSLPSWADYATQLREGVGVLRHSRLGAAVVAVAAVTLLTSAAMAVLPAFAANAGGPRTYGLLLGAFAAGTLGGTLVAGRAETVPLGPLVAVAFAGAALAWTAAVVASSVVLTAALLAVAFVPVGLYNVLASSALQVGVPEEKVGRVSAVTGSLGGVAAPVGLLAGGVLGDAFTPRAIMLVAGSGFALAAACWLGVPSLRSFPAIGELDRGSFDP